MAGDNKAVPEKAGKRKFSRRAFVVGSGTVLAGGFGALRNLRSQPFPAVRQYSRSLWRAKHFSPRSRFFRGAKAPRKAAHFRGVGAVWTRGLALERHSRESENPAFRFAARDPRLRGGDG